MKALKQCISCILLIMIALVCYTSCSEKDNKCKNADCQNGGVCSNGFCTCPAGYTGTHCELQDKCYGVTCLHAGTCSNGICNCTVGYEGKYCDTASRDKFLGNWLVTEKGSMSFATQYYVRIAEGDSLTAVINVVIENFYNYFTKPLNAYVKRDSIFIPTQNYQGKVVFGYGYCLADTFGSYNKIVMKYEVVDSATNLINDFGYNASVDHSLPSTWTK